MREVVQAPVPLLLSPDLPASAKVVWMVSRLGPGGDRVSTTWLSATAGLSRPTVLTGVALLTSAGWDPQQRPEGGQPQTPHSPRGPNTPDRPGGSASVPIALLTNPRLGAQAKVLYGVLLLTPGFNHPSGTFTYAELAGLTHASRNRLARALNQLVRADWLKVDRAHRLARIRFELSFPGFEAGMIALTGAQRRLSRGTFFGEGLMREYLSLLVDAEDYENDAAPGFLVNPRTDEHLQLDRFYPPRVAFEFNGPQHYRGTQLFTADEANRQRERDYIKMGICWSRGIELVIVHPEDLTLEGMRLKIQDLLPLRDLTGCELLIDYLESESRAYIRLASKF